MAGCIGCGYCCTKSPCLVSWRLLGISDKCKFLHWNGKRHLCLLITNNEGEERKKYEEELSIGTECSSPMFNTFRQELKDRTDIKYERSL